MNTSILMMLAAIVIVGVILLAIIFFGKNTGRTHLNKDKYREKWLNITNSLTESTESQQLAILQADKLLDLALKERGTAGETLGERMKNAKDLFSDRNGIWTAHKLRNHIAHDHDVKLDIRKTRKALNSFKVALRDIGAL